MSERRARVQASHPLPKTRRCELLDVTRSTAYYQPEVLCEEDLKLMRRIDEIHLQYPAGGSATSSRSKAMRSTASAYSD